MNFGAEEVLRAGDPALALRQLQEAVRAAPSDAKLRVFLFQLLCILGQWERALTQLDLCAQMDAAAVPMRETYRQAIHCERLRAEVFKGAKSPMLFGEPEGWIALLIESLIRAGQGETTVSARLRDDAFDAAPATAGTLDGESFTWIADADMRLGPVLEAIVNNRYYWIPFSRLARIDLEAPSDLRDYVWAPVHLQFSNGGETVALIPTRYPGSEAADDGLLALGRKTVWTEPVPEFYLGMGQRVIATDRGDYPLLDIRSIVFDADAEPAPVHG
jgi:type VI secretion system protein ImpE